MTVNELRGRQAKLDALARGLMKEIAVIREANDPLLFPERRKYLAALGNALAGAQSARVALQAALARLADEGRRAG